MSPGYIEGVERMGPSENEASESEGTPVLNRLNPSDSLVGQVTGTGVGVHLDCLLSMMMSLLQMGKTEAEKEQVEKFESGISGPFSLSVSLCDNRLRYTLI